MITLTFGGPLRDCFPFEKGRLHLAVMAALHGVSSRNGN